MKPSGPGLFFVESIYYRFNLLTSCSYISNFLFLHELVLIGSVFLEFVISCRFSNLLYSCLYYSLTILFISVASVVLALLSYLIFIVWVFFVFLVHVTKGLPILLILSKNQLLVSLIFSIVFIFFSFIFFSFICDLIFIVSSLLALSLFFFFKFLRLLIWNLSYFLT